MENFAQRSLKVWHFRERVQLPAEGRVSHFSIRVPRLARNAGVRIGSMDLRIACITMAHDATLLTRDTVDFGKVPGLRFENWLE